MDKIDFKKELKHLYAPSQKDFTMVEVPPMQFLMVDGHGDPNRAAEYGQAVEALYSVAYKLKFTSKKEKGLDYTVLPLEGLWWVEDMREFSIDDKDAWDWTMMIGQPEWIEAEMVEKALGQADPGLPALGKLRFETYHEGLAVQILHIGPYSTEGPTLARMHHEFIPQNGYRMAGKHHEIYLGDPRKTAPEKLKTVLRQPVERIEEIK